MPVALAILCALIWGTADFCGGSATRRVSSAVVLLWASAIALPVLALVALLAGETSFTATTVGWGAVAGVSGALGIAALYEGLATGAMGVVAPIASTSVVVPVVYGFATGADVRALCAIGIAVAIVGVVLAGGPDLREFRSGAHRPLVMALIAAIGIGISLIAVAEGSAVQTLPTLVSMRAVYVVVLVPIVLLTARGERPDRSALGLIAVVGLGDATAVTLYGIATRTGPLPVVAALASMFPVATLVLARQLHHERLSREQWVGVVTALLGVVMVVATQ